MSKRRISGIAAALFAVSLCAGAQNLIANPGNEMALVNHEIPGWIEAVGTTWGQRSADPAPYEGSYYFFAGAVANATLRQVVDVSGFASQIDSGSLGFQFSGWVRSWPQSPADTSTIALTLLDSGGAVLSSFTSGELANTAAWENISTFLAAPALTRSVQIDLIAKRRAGSNNDGYFDGLSLMAAPVPEPASVGLLLLGACAVGLRVRAKRKLEARRIA